MGRYGPAPETTAPPPPPPEDPLRRWSFRRKALAVLASGGMVAAFVFNFLSPTSNGFRKKTTTTVSSTAVSSTAVASTTTPTTVFATTVPGGVVSR